MKKHLIFISVLTLLAVQSFAQKGGFYATTSKEKILIGEPFSVTLQATIAKGKSVQWRPDSIPHFEILAKSKIDTQVTGGELNLKQTLTVTSWDSGRWELSPFPQLQLKRGIKPIIIDVTFSAFDPAQNYHDIKDIMEVAKPERVTWYWYLIGAAL
ncbi:MAG TPA: hypothetical protein VM888_02610, partial [Chitinophagaceae bacterium]|nr:hypothetical protein [Chitinophagaceae bacterium]